jgi:DNA-binding transcriptional ArsR family regulator
VRALYIVLFMTFMVSVLGLVSLKLVPGSVQVHIGALSGCKVTDKADLEKQKQTVLYKLSGYFFRLKHLYVGGSHEYRDYISAKKGVLDALILASTFYENTNCDAQVLPIFKKYIARGADVDFYGEEGLTPLHAAIIWNKFEFVKTLSENSANRNLRVKLEGRKISDKTALELVVFLNKLSPNPTRLKILELLSK